MSNKHLIIIDPVEKLDLKKDTSLKTARALFMQNEDVYLCQASDLFWFLEHSSPFTYAQKITFLDSQGTLSSEAKEEISLSAFSCIHIRKEPPVNFNYMYLNLLLQKAEKNTLIYNSPRALLTFNEKLLPFDYPRDSILALNSTKPEIIKKFITDHCKGEAVIKKLNLFGGKEVKYVNEKELSVEALNKILIEETNDGQSPIQVQAFMKEIYDGELRVFTAKGRIIASCLKKPAAGSFLANTSSGASIEAAVLPKKIENMVTNIATELCKKGIFFTGFDIISDKISEINITSPRLLVAQKDDSPYFDTIADLIIKDLKEKKI